MAALALSTLLTQVRDLVGDQTPAYTGGTNNTRFSDAQITDAINYACQDLCIRNGYSYTEAAVTATTPFASYSLASILDYLIIRRILLSGQGELLASAEADEDLRNPFWRTATADMVTAFPRRWLLKDGATVLIIPAAAQAYPTNGTTVTITVGYIQRPTILVANTDTVDSRIPWPVQIYLKYAAASWLKQFSGTDQTDLAQAQAWMTMFLGYIGGE